MENVWKREIKSNPRWFGFFSSCSDENKSIGIGPMIPVNVFTDDFNLSIAVNIFINNGFSLISVSCNSLVNKSIILMNNKKRKNCVWKFWRSQNYIFEFFSSELQSIEIFW